MSIFFNPNNGQTQTRTSHTLPATASNEQRQERVVLQYTSIKWMKRGNTAFYYRTNELGYIFMNTILQIWLSCHEPAIRLYTRTCAYSTNDVSLCACVRYHAVATESTDYMSIYTCTLVERDRACLYCVDSVTGWPCCTDCNGWSDVLPHNPAEAIIVSVTTILYECVWTVPHSHSRSLARVRIHSARFLRMFCPCSRHR